MKQDKLEKFVSNNRQAFDKFEPTIEIWKQINNNIQHKKPNLFIKISWQVVAAVAIFIASYYFHNYIQGDKVHYTNTVKQIKKTHFNTKQVIQSKVAETSIPKIIELKIISKPKKPLAKKKQTENNSYSELNELSVYYTSKINKEKNDLFILTANNPEVKTEINNEFGKLDKAYKELKNDLKENINNEQVIEAMIENYKLKMEMLEFIKRQVSIEITKKNDKNETKYDM
ncbi:MAG: hypothetical protein A2X08_14355 [Bacteroidetes bacterium GWA2_32_17]|nr:MAG: hypothetical protein A2X08_14355 [Bacteroidetes bacterium GWA2_32_17]